MIISISDNVFLPIHRLGLSIGHRYRKRAVASPRRAAVRGVGARAARGAAAVQGRRQLRPDQGYQHAAQTEAPPSAESQY